MRAFAVFFFLFVALPAQAQTGKTTPVLVCDTQAQAERYVELWGQGVIDPRGTVNREHKNPAACIGTMLDYYTQRIVAFLQNSAGVFRITQIVVLGVETTAGYRPVQTPSILYKVLRTKEVGA